MAKLSQDRDTKRREGTLYGFEAGANIFAGSLVSLNAAGKAVPSTADGTVCVGVAEHAAKSGEPVRVRRGVFALDGDASAAFTRADVGSECVVVDDHTVGTQPKDGTAPVAGLIVDVDAQGVWVRI